MTVTLSPLTGSPCESLHEHELNLPPSCWLGSEPIMGIIASIGTGSCPEDPPHHHRGLGAQRQGLLGKSIESNVDMMNL